MTETMTASEAREWLAKSEENRVKDRNGDKWSSYGLRWHDSDTFAPFTIHRTKRQLREECERLTQRAETAEARVKELEAE